MYFDLFNHNAASNIVRLISAPIAANGEQICMAFWFAAFGAGEDADLKVIRMDNSTNSENPNDQVRTKPLLDKKFLPNFKTITFYSFGSFKPKM